jgi:hypothetical protein
MAPWLQSSLQVALKKYREKVNAAYFQEKYPGLPADAIVDRRIDLAQKYAVDLSYTSLLQLRLAYDINVIYGKPLDYDDPEDLYDLLVLAFGIKAGEAFSQSLQKLSPEAVRILIKKTITDSSLKQLKALPVVGKFLLQRNLIKMAIPVVGIGSRIRG